jgi:GDP-L-fucose synthase
MKLTDKIYVAGHNGLVGSAIVRLLKKKGYTNIIFRSSKELDLRDQKAVNEFFEFEQPSYVFMAAAKVGGILANQSYPAEFLYDNIAIQSNVIHSSYKWGVEKLLFLGSSCIYPKNAPQPILESYLMTGYLEPTNEPYAIAKISGINMCQSYHRQYGCNFISVMPPNLFGPGDNYDLYNAHVLPALLRKFHEAKLNNQPCVTVWGSGNPRREFLHVDDAAMACYFLMQKYDSPEIVNIGTGLDSSIKEIANLIKKVTEYSGSIQFDESKPDGTPRKLLNVDKINNLGWKSAVDLENGIEMTYRDFILNYSNYTKPKNFKSADLIQA